MTDPTQLFGAEISSVQQTDTYLDWLLAKTERPLDSDASLQYAILQCFDTYVWGILKDFVWVWSSDIENAGINAPTKSRLLEARIFGIDADVLIWKTTDGFAGRTLKNSALTPREVQSPLERHALFQPSERDKSNDGSKNENHIVKDTDIFLFVRREMPDGRTTITPRGKYVLIHEYLSETNDGVLRIAATRFVEVK